MSRNSRLACLYLAALSLVAAGFACGPVVAAWGGL